MPSCVIESLGQGEDIVLLHGWGANRSVWSPLLDSLKNKLRCHLVDLPGCGLAQENQVVEFDALLDELAQQLPDQAIYCGWSLGGLIAMVMAHRYPRKVKRLLTIASSPCFVARGDWPGIKPQLMDGFMQGIEANSRLTLKRFIGLQSLYSITAKEDRAHLQGVLKTYPFPQQQALQLGLEWLNSIDLRSEVALIEQPWDAFFGNRDAIVPLQTMRALQEMHAQIKVHQLQQAGHLALLSHSEEILSSLA